MILSSASWGEPRPVLVGDLATVREPLPGTTPCEAVDEWFRADEDRRSVLVLVDGGVAVVNRARFYLSITGELGFGRALHYHRPIELVAPGASAALDAGRRAEEVADELVTGAFSSEDDLLVRWPDDRLGSVGVAELFQALSDLHAARATEARNNERRFRALVQNSSDVTVVLASDGTVAYESPAVGRVLGATPTCGDPFVDRAHADDRVELAALLDGCQAESDYEFVGHVRMADADGHWRELELSARNLLEEPAVAGIVINYRDVTERRALEREIHHRAYHDVLTDLPNRALFFERLTGALEAAAVTGDAVSVLFCDLDGFKGINDGYGHAAGDELLQAVAGRFANAIREEDTLARLGGDEFAVIVAGGQEVAEAIAARVVDVLRDPVSVGRRTTPISTSVGLAVCEQATLDVGTLVHRADIAMYAAKSAGKDRVVTYDVSHASVHHGAP
jgi:diguanylate cyclase (GGDEF)-like protein/PAS domain S-box-containing protein